MKGNPMRSDAERIAKYIAKVVPSTVGLKIAAQLETMKTGFGSAIEDLVEKELLVQGILNGETVPGIDYPFYYSFGREIFKRDRAGIGGPSLISAVEALIAKYDAYGLSAPILVRIADEVFTIQLAPIAPLLLLPEDEAIEVPKAGDLTWSAAARATGYDVWLFEDGETPAKVSTNQPGLTYAYTGLTKETVYRWYVIAKNIYGDTSSEERTFTTENT